MILVSCDCCDCWKNYLISAVWGAWAPVLAFAVVPLLLLWAWGVLGGRATTGPYSWLQDSILNLFTPYSPISNITPLSTQISWDPRPATTGLLLLIWPGPTGSIPLQADCRWIPPPAIRWLGGFARYCHAMTTPTTQGLPVSLELILRIIAA